MNKRITSIALFDKQSLEKLEDITNTLDMKFCKVPYREEEREKLDTLPYHFTFCVWDVQDKDKAIDTFKEVNCKEIILNIIGLRIKESYNNSWNLYFDMEQNVELYRLQKEIYSKSRIEKYNPDTFIPHITIHCDRDYNKIIDLKKKLDKDFIPFKVRFDNIGLFEIYPAERLEV
jgi:2'-5' RNA ligase